MGRAPCCDKAKVKKGPWSPEEDAKLKSYIEQHGTGGNWIALPHKIGLKRCGKSCRLRWLNYLRPNIKHGGFSEQEDNIICSLYVSIGSRWSIIAAQLPGRTDNDIKNYWNTRLKKKLLVAGKQQGGVVQHDEVKTESIMLESSSNMMQRELVSPTYSTWAGSIQHQHQHYYYNYNDVNQQQQQQQQPHPNSNSNSNSNGSTSGDYSSVSNMFDDEGGLERLSNELLSDELVYDNKTSSVLVDDDDAILVYEMAQQHYYGMGSAASHSATPSTDSTNYNWGDLDITSHPHPHPPLVSQYQPPPPNNYIIPPHHYHYSSYFGMQIQ